MALDYLFLVGAVKGPLIVTGLADGMDGLCTPALVAEIVVILRCMIAAIHTPQSCRRRHDAAKHTRLNEPARAQMGIVTISVTISGLNFLAVPLTVLLVIFRT